MDAIEIPTYKDLLAPSLWALRDLGGSATTDEINGVVIESLRLSDEQLAVAYPPESNQRETKISHRLSWARTYLKKMGFAENSERGVWSLLPSSRPILDLSPHDADIRLQELDATVRKASRIAKKNSVSLSEVADEDDAGDPSEIGSSDWEDILLGQLMAIEPDSFERLSQRLLREAGFRNVEVLGKSGDGGLDVVGVYKVSLVSFTVYCQCKRYKGSVGSSAVRDFRGAMSGRGEKGLLITTGTFTAEAVREAARDGAPPVELIGGTELCELLKEYKLGVSTHLVEAVEVNTDFFAQL
jgi:restriction system protein